MYSFAFCLLTFQLFWTSDNTFRFMWTHQPGSHRGKATQGEGHTGVFSPPSFSGACRGGGGYREKDSAISFLRRSTLVGHDVKEIPGSCDCVEIRTHVPTSEGFEITNRTTRATISSHHTYMVITYSKSSGSTG